ncbi:ribosome biogenesis GTPase Der [Hyphococcus flavus]|uniref:GTPase Der n=1 Tax=Hyphococcus flavus TaxID=1866326 RepID=A0AAE9ZJ85_9PROT|nr:ribosome biogenesis GTPase Der [Hyphococcus flavus]WDI31485.1 ribosome biogenesis GTPase Der [Hyphococcus flavus]
MAAKIALVGRPNVGKSTLFNRLVGKRLALVDDTPGVTRDRREGEAKLGDLSFTVVDTPGLEEAPEAALEGRMRQQTDRAVEDAAACLFMIDARAGVTPLDKAFASILRSSGKPVILLANKAEGSAANAGLYDAYALGVGEPIAISAEHGEGMGDLYAALESFLATEEAVDESNDEIAWDDPLKPLRVAIVGRPNAGKSTLVNKLIGEDRLLTGPEAGITRDSISVEWRWQGKNREWPVKLFDTAGMRKKARVQSKLEKLSVSDALRAIKFAEVVVMLLDAETPFEKQDLQIADLALREGRALVIGVNKWDLIEERNTKMRSLQEMAGRLLPQAPGVPIVAFSAKTGAGLNRIMPAVTQVYVDWNARVKTSELNDWLQEATSRHAPPAVSGQRIKLRYIAQTKTRPPTFVAQCTRAEEVPDSYKRYLVNGIRDAFDIKAVPIRLILKKPDNPYAHKEKRKH